MVAVHLGEKANLLLRAKPYKYECCCEDKPRGANIKRAKKPFSATGDTGLGSPQGWLMFLGTVSLGLGQCLVRGAWLQLATALPAQRLLPEARVMGLLPCVLRLGGSKLFQKWLL